MRGGSGLPRGDLPPTEGAVEVVIVVVMAGEWFLPPAILFTPSGLIEEEELKIGTVVVAVVVVVVMVVMGDWGVSPPLCPSSIPLRRGVRSCGAGVATTMPLVSRSSKLVCCSSCEEESR